MQAFSGRKRRFTTTRANAFVETNVSLNLSITTAGRSRLSRQSPLQFDRESNSTLHRLRDSGVSPPRRKVAPQAILAMEFTDESATDDENDDGRYNYVMGITIHYHGKIAELDRVQEFEDRVVDMASKIGATVRVWRSSPDHEQSRIVRGLILNVSPGQEPTSLLISPEGWLIPLHEIEAAENGTLAEPPYCFVKTQFGSVEGHVAVVELLSFLKQEFFPNLYVSDESGYWEDRDVVMLAQKFAALQAAIDMVSEGLENSPLSAEAAEDPEIVATRVERIARQVDESVQIREVRQP